MSNDLAVVCGASGFLGRALLHRLYSLGFTNLRAISRKKVVLGEGVQQSWGLDLFEPDQAFAAVEGARFVFNLAACVGGYGYITSHPLSCLASAQINQNLLRACSEQGGVKRYFFASSSCVYGDSASPLSEADASAIPATDYGLEKIFSEHVCLAYHNSGRVPCTIARIHGLYGPGDHRAPGRGHVIEDLVKKVVCAYRTGVHEISIIGDGNQTRSFIYIDDAVDGICKLTSSGVTGPVNLAGSPASVGKLVTLLENISGITLRRSSIADAGACQNKVADLSQLKAALLGWVPETTLEEGLTHTYADCLNTAFEVTT